MLDCWEQKGRDRPDFEQLVMRIKELQDNIVRNILFIYIIYKFERAYYQYDHNKNNNNVSNNILATQLLFLNTV